MNSKNFRIDEPSLFPRMINKQKVKIIKRETGDQPK